MPQWKKNLIVIWLSQILAMIGFGLSQPYIAQYIREMGVTDNDRVKLYVGITGFLFSFSMAIFSPLWGYLADRYGRKKMVLRAFISSSIILFLTGQFKFIGAFIILRILQGALTGTVPASNMFFISTTPKEHLSQAVSIMFSAIFIGSALGPVLGSVIANAWSLEATFYIGSLLLSLGVWFIALFVREDKNSYGPAEAHEESFGFLKMMRQIGLLLGAITIFIFSKTMFDPFVMLYLEKLKAPGNILSMTGYITMSLNLVSALGTFLLSRLHPAQSKYRLIYFSSWLILLILTVLFSLENFYVFAVLFVLMSFFASVIEPILTTLSAERINEKYRSQMYGYLNMLVSIGWMLAPLTGSILSIRFGFRTIFAGMMFGYLAVILMLKRDAGKRSI